MHFEQIENTLPSLTLEQLKVLKKQILYLLKTTQNTEKLNNEDPDVEKELLYHLFVKQFPTEIAPNYAIFKKIGDKIHILLFNEMFQYLKSLPSLLSLPNNRINFVNISSFAVATIVNDLRKSNIHCCFRVILVDRRWELFQSILDNDFPGYVRSGLFLKILPVTNERT